MIWLLAAILASLGTELFLRLPIGRAMREMGCDGRKAGQAIRSPLVSDHWKQRISRFYARRMARQTVLLAGCFALIGMLLVPCWLLADRLNPDFSRFVLSPLGLVFSLLAGLAYLGVKRRLAR